jgi:hypothetical protein
MGLLSKDILNGIVAFVGLEYPVMAIYITIEKKR